MTLLQLLFTYWPPMQNVFGSTAISYDEWLLIIGVGIVIYATAGLEKLLLRQRKKLN
jgi:Ca2+-transporting ATPase